MQAAYFLQPGAIKPSLCCRKYGGREPWSLPRYILCSTETLAKGILPLPSEKGAEDWLNHTPQDWISQQGEKRPVQPLFSLSHWHWPYARHCAKPGSSAILPPRYSQCPRQVAEPSMIPTPANPPETARRQRERERERLVLPGSEGREASEGSFPKEARGTHEVVVSSPDGQVP